MFKFLILSLFLTSYISINNGQSGTLDVRQVNVDGFGDPNNNYAFAMEVYSGQLYVATNNVVTALGMAGFFLGLPFETEGTQIWRGFPDQNGDYNFERVVNAGNGNPLNFGIRKLQTVGKFIYAVTSNHVSGFEIWRSENGTIWEVEVVGGFGNVDNKSGRGLFVFNGFLYVGVENRATGGKIYRRQIDTNTGDYAPGSSWDLIVDNGNGNGLNWWFSDFVEWTDPNTNVNYLYVGTLNPLGFNVFRSSDGVTFNPVVLFGNGAIGNSAVMDLVVYQNKIYVGTMNFFRGTSLFVSSDGVTFSAVYTNGNTDSRNAYTWWMNEYNARLYVGTFNTGDILDPAVPGAFDLYSKNDPSDPNEAWAIETDDGYGNPGQYGIRTMEVFGFVGEEKLMIGTATASVEGSLKVYEGTEITARNASMNKVPRLVDAPRYNPNKPRLISDTLKKSQVAIEVEEIKAYITKFVVDAGIDPSKLYD